MNGRGHRIIGDRRWCCFHVGDQVGARVVTGFGQMHFIASPGGGPFGRIAHGHIVRGTDIASCRWQIIIVAPGQLFIAHQEVLEPDLAERLRGWQVAQRGGVVSV